MTSSALRYTFVYPRHLLVANRDANARLAYMHDPRTITRCDEAGLTCPATLVGLPPIDPAYIAGLAQAMFYNLEKTVDPDPNWPDAANSATKRFSHTP